MDLFADNIDWSDGQLDNCRECQRSADGCGGREIEEKHEKGGPERARANAGKPNARRDQEANQDFSHGSLGSSTECSSHISADQSIVSMEISRRSEEHTSELQSL